MKKGCLFASGALLILFLVAAGSVVFLVARVQAPRVERGSFVEIRIGGSIPENVLEDGLFGGTPTTMRDIADVLEWAGDDERVEGIVLRIEPLGVGWAKLQEIRDQIEGVRTKGKTVVAFLEAGDDGEYYLASVADKVFMMPMGNLGMDGLTAELEFYRGLLDKIGVEYDGIHVGEFKSAPEQYSRTGMSDASREQYEALLDSLFDGYVTAISTSRKMPRDKVRELIDQGPYQATAAKEKGLVDELLYWDEFEEWVKASSTNEPQIIEASRVRHMASRRNDPGAFSRSNIAVVYATGQILSGESSDGGFGGSVMGSETIADALREAREDDTVKAVVLRVDSPGGSVIASDVMWREVQVTKGKKPVIVSMSDVAASGGYYISMGANGIVAQPGTITGSIGIFTGKFVTTGLYGKVGLSTESIKRGAFADMYTGSRKFTEIERKKIEDELQDAYAVFIGKVADGRSLDVATVDGIARGRVWTGADAKEIGLVDELGGLDKAIELAKAKAGLTGDPGVVVLPRRKSFWDSLNESGSLIQLAPPGLRLPEPAEQAMSDVEALSRLPQGEPTLWMPVRVTVE